MELSADKYKEISDVAQRVELLERQVNAWKTIQDVQLAKEEAKERFDAQCPALLNQMAENQHTIDRIRRFSLRHPSYFTG